MIFLIRVILFPNKISLFEIYISVIPCVKNINGGHVQQYQQNSKPARHPVLHWPAQARLYYYYIRGISIASTDVLKGRDARESLVRTMRTGNRIHTMCIPHRIPRERKRVKQEEIRHKDSTKARYVEEREHGCEGEKWQTRPNYH